MPWAALPSRSAGSRSCPSLGNLTGNAGVNSTQHCFLAPQRKPVRPRGFTRTCLRRRSPPDPSPLCCDGKSRQLSNGPFLSFHSKPSLRVTGAVISTLFSLPSPTSSRVRPSPVPEKVPSLPLPPSVLLRLVGKEITGTFEVSCLDLLAPYMIRYSYDWIDK